MASHITHQDGRLAPDQGQLFATRVLNGRYRLDEIVGSGTTATVWRAWDRRLDRAVAVKVLDGTGFGRNARERARFNDEARTLARLSHPNIVAVFDSGTENGVAYVVMELVEGRSAVWWLADGVMPVAEAATVLAQVCDALAAAHAAGVVHRDVKPGNILFGPGRTVKVCDFGIARLLDATALTSSDIVGTSGYMSPEHVAGGQLDGRADLYSVGCVLFEMLTGTAPFVGDDPFKVAYQQLHNQPPTVRSRRPDIPEDLDGLVGRLLAKDPAQRPATAAEVRAELLRWSDPARTIATAATRRRRPIVQAGVATMAAIAVAAALLAAWPDKEAKPPAAAVSPTSTAMASDTPAPSVSPTEIVTSPAATAPFQQPQSLPPSPRSALDQIMGLKALVRQLETTGQLPPNNADELDHMLSDLGHLVVEGKRREAQDKFAAIQKKNDDLLAAGKISPAGHLAIEGGLDPLAVAISGMPTA